MFRSVCNAILIMGLVNFLTVYNQIYNHRIKYGGQRTATSRPRAKSNDKETVRVVSALTPGMSEGSPRSFRVKRENGNEWCNTSLTDFKCNDGHGKRSCRGRCGETVTVENATSFYCHCDDLCSHFDDCCVDFAKLCRGCNSTGQNIVNNQTIFGSENERCALLVQSTERPSFRCTRVQGAVSVFLKAKCHKDFRNSALEKKCLGDQETYSKVPCYDPTRGIHYKNKYCAECNYGHRIALWRLKIECHEEFYQNHFNLGNASIPRLMEFIHSLKPLGRGTRIDYLEPLLATSPNIRKSARPCINAEVECQSCKDTGLEASCRNHGLYPIQLGLVYRNAHCLSCNNKQMSALACRLIQFADRNIDSLQAFSFQILMDVTEDAMNLKTVADKEHTNVVEMAVACSDNGDQCRLKKCYGPLRKVGETCDIDIVDLLVNVEIKWKLSQLYYLDITLYIKSQIFKIFSPLGVVVLTSNHKWPMEGWNVGYKYNVVFKDSPYVAKTINMTMAEKLVKLQEKLNNFLLLNNMSAYSPSFISIDYDVTKRGEGTAMTTARSLTATPIPVDTMKTAASTVATGSMAASTVVANKLAIESAFILTMTICLMHYYCLI